MSLLYFLIAVLVIAVLIAIHELGHFTAGRLLGFKILDYSIGFGPAIFKFKKKDITYALRAIPLGGSCRFYGETEQEEGETVEPGAIPFNEQKPWKRLIVIFAGPFMNFLLAYVLAVLMLVCCGEQRTRDYSNGDLAVAVIEVSEGSAAERAGVQPGDIIMSVNGKDLSNEQLTFEERTNKISKEIQDYKEGDLILTVERDGALIDLAANGLYNEKEGKNLLGISMGYMTRFERLHFFPALKRGASFLVDIVKTTFEALANGFRKGFNEGELTGIVGTFVITMKMAERGLYYVLLIPVLLSMSLGIMNLLPILPLDGGHLLFDFIELVFRKPVPRKIQNALSAVGFILLIGLMIYVTIGDIRGIAHGIFDF